MSTTEAFTFNNRKWIVKSRPNGMFNPSENVEVIEEVITLSCGPTEVIVRVEMLSVDAFIRTMLDGKAFHGTVELNDVVPALGYGIIIHAGSQSNLKVGTSVAGLLGAQKYATVLSSQVQPCISLPFMPKSASLTLLGVTSGLTAYAGTFYTSKPPRRGETVVVTAASGSVGHIAAQLLKTTGATVIGIAGGKKKQSFLINDLKLDGAIDYKHSNLSVEKQIKDLCPNGVDFVFDNVGGEILDSLLDNMNSGARVVICGAISQYSGNLNKGKVRGPSKYLKLAEKGASMTGFVVTQYLKSIPHILIMIMWMVWYYFRGFVVVKEHIEDGIDQFPSTLEKLFTGGTIGKALIDLTKESPTRQEINGDASPICTISKAVPAAHIFSPCSQESKERGGPKDQQEETKKQ